MVDTSLPIIECECGGKLRVVSHKDGKIVVKECARCAVDYYNQGIRYEIKSEEKMKQILKRFRNERNSDDSRTYRSSDARNL